MSRLQQIRVTFDPMKISLKEIAETLVKLGVDPDAIKWGNERAPRKDKEKEK